MTDKPIIFSTPMVQALLAGRKTQTRRTSGLSDVNARPNVWALNRVGPLGYMAKASAKGKFGATFETRDLTPGTLHICPQRLPYAPGDRLWVREAFATWDGFPGDTVYRADVLESDWQDLKHDARNGAPWKIHSPIHMPRTASRLTLIVTDVRVQRLQDISDRDAEAEGCASQACGGCGLPKPYDNCIGCHHEWFKPAFRKLWNSLHGEGAWNENPWVFAVTFEVGP